MSTTQSRDNKPMNVLYCIILNGRITQAEWQYEDFGEATINSCKQLTMCN